MEQKQELKRVGVLSAFKLCFIIGLALGLIMGLIYGGMLSIFVLFGMLSSMKMGGIDVAGMGLVAFLIAIVALIVFTLVYGIICGIFGAIYALVYNLAAKYVGGIELEFKGTE